MEKITYSELYNKMYNFNKENPDKQNNACISGVIVYKASNWEKPYSETSRSYKVWNCCRAFQEGKISNSIFGDCLDFTEDGVRLDWYNWDVEYCYMNDELQI